MSAPSWTPTDRAPLSLALLLAGSEAQICQGLALVDSLAEPLDAATWRKVMELLTSPQGFKRGHIASARLILGKQAALWLRGFCVDCAEEAWRVGVDRAGAGLSPPFFRTALSRSQRVWAAARASASPPPGGHRQMKSLRRRLYRSQRSLDGGSPGWGPHRRSPAGGLYLALAVTKATCISSVGRAANEAASGVDELRQRYDLPPWARAWFITRLLQVRPEPWLP